MEEKKSYLQQRVYDLLGLTEEQCSVPLWIDRLTPAKKRKHTYEVNGEKREQWLKDENGNLIADPFPLFQSDENDNIRMFPYTLDGRLIRYESDKQPKYSDYVAEETYFITRRNPQWLAENPGQPKYKFPGGETKKGTYPFFPPLVYQAYCDKQHIDTVILTEGYMKAMAASVHGMMVVGLGSITLFADQRTKQLYPDVVRLLNTVQPNNIVILYDGDCTDIGKSAIEELEANRTPNLSKRPYSFMNSLLKLKDMLLEFKNPNGQPCELFFAYVKKMRRDKEILLEDGKTKTVNDSPKGLDDLICDEEFKSEVDDIAKDLNNPGRPGVYFHKTNLRTCNDTKIRGVFNCSSPEKFYEAWHQVIGAKKFKFNSGVYYYNPAEKKLVQALDNTLKDYYAIGSEIVLVTEAPIPNSSGTSTEFVSISDKVINAQFGDGTAKRLYRHKYFVNYTVMPDHENYCREIITESGYRFFNMYSPLNYKPIEHEWPTIKKLLRQITKVYGEEYYQMLLDWITLTYFRPTQFLPIIMLVSKQRGTGKTSFLNLLKTIYGNNAVVGGNDLIMSKFNSLLAGKLIVGVDESTLGDNKEVGEALKHMSTAEYMHIERKGKDKQEVRAFCKFVLCSNEVKKGVFIAKDEVRFWVMRLEPWDEDQGGFDKDFKKKIEEEVQGFLFYIRERWYRNKMFVKESEGRMWFDPKRIANADLAKMMSGTQSNFEGSLIDYLENMFIDTGKSLLHFDVQYIWDNVPDARRKDQQYIRNLLDDMPGVTKEKNSGKFKMPFRVTELMKRTDSSIKADEGDVMWPSAGKQCRPYAFDAKYFLSPEQYEKLKAPKQKGAVGDEKSTPTQATLPLDAVLSSATHGAIGDIPADAKVDDNISSIF